MQESRFPSQRAPPPPGSPGSFIEVCCCVVVAAAGRGFIAPAITKARSAMRVSDLITRMIIILHPIGSIPVGLNIRLVSHPRGSHLHACANVTLGIARIEILLMREGVTLYPQSSILD